MSRQPLVSVAVVLAVALVVSAGLAQAQGLVGTTAGADPFSLYFGYYLPHQAYIAAQPTALDTINQVTAARQFQAVTDRAGLYDPISPYGDEEVDPLRPYSPNRKGERLAKPQATPGSTANTRGTGPSAYYSRTARYYPQMRVARGPNRNLGVTRGRFGGGGGMPSMPSAPGPR